jgi:MFS family permease
VQDTLTRPRAAPVVSRAQWIVGGALAALLLAANLPTPLYAGYERSYGFSKAMLTVIFATYALVLIPSLLVFGQLSDRLGRRKVMLYGLVAGAVGLALFAAAQGILWLFAARAAQGVAVGMTTGTATAALVELEPHGDHQHAALLAVLAQAGGSATAPLLAGALAEWAPAPRRLCYLVGLGLTAAVAIGVRTIREPGHAGGVWRVQRPSVPAEVRARFVRCGLTAAAVWAVGALFVSIVPSYAASLLHTSNLALLGAVASVMLASACGSQVVSLRRSLPPHVAQPLGLGLLALGLGVLVVAFPAHSLGLVLGAALLAGAGLGFGFFGAQTEINLIAPPDRRGEVTAAFIVCIYLGVSAAAISVGLLTEGVSLFVAVACVAGAVAATAVLTAVWHALGARPA